MSHRSVSVRKSGKLDSRSVFTPLFSPGSVGSYPPTPPQTRTSGFPAYGSSSDGHARPSAQWSRPVYGHSGLCVPWPVTRLHPITRTAPFPTPRLRRSPFACFTCGTMKLLRLPIFSRRPAFVGLVGDTLGSGPRTLSALPSSQRTPMCLCRALGLRPSLGAWPSRRLGAAPRQQNEEGLDDLGAFGALSHGLGTGCLRFVPPSLATTQNSLPRVASLSRVGLQFTH